MDIIYAQVLKLNAMKGKCKKAPMDVTEMMELAKGLLYRRGECTLNLHFGIRLMAVVKVWMACQLLWQRSHTRAVMGLAMTALSDQLGQEGETREVEEVLRPEVVVAKLVAMDLLEEGPRS